MATISPGEAGSPLLPVPEIPVLRSGGPNERPFMFTAGHHFSLVGDVDQRELTEAATAPLSVMVPGDQAVRFRLRVLLRDAHDARSRPGPA
jgi:hypothetical protein